MADETASGKRTITEYLVRGVLSGMLFAVLVHVIYVLLGGNFRTVLPGAVYRCAQPSPQRLERLIEKHGIRTVVNLRGCCPTAEWYRKEAQTTAKMDIAQEDISFSATRLPSTVSLRQLMEVLDRSAYPLLFHCHQGADRTGLAAVMVKLMRTEASLDEALEELSVRGGHLPIGRTRHVDRFFEMYRDWLVKIGEEHCSALFRLWAERYYCPGDGRAEMKLLCPAEQRAEAPPLLRVVANQARLVHVRCQNRSEDAWEFQPGTTSGIHLYWSLLDHDHRTLRCDRSGLFQAVVEPGESIDLTVPLPPLAPGRYELRVDLINEQHAFFLQVGNDPLVIDLEVS